MFRYPGHGLIAFGVLALGVLAAPVWAAEKLEYAAAEAWITKEAPAKPDEAWAGAPAQILLQNMQIRFEADGTTTYHTEIAVKIQTAAGLQLAQSWVTWNPATDTAIVNKAQIVRGDTVIDVLAKGQTFTTVRREQNLDKAMLDGYLTGVLQPEGLEVGDTYVFATSIRRRDPVFGGKAEAILSGLSAGPAARQVVRATWDAARPIQWRQSDDLKGRVTKAGNQETYAVERTKVTPAETQANAPARFNQRGQLEFTQFASWDEVSSLLAPLYTKAATLPADSALHKEISTIRAASNDPRVQAAMALRLVQNQVRYVFLGMNLGGYMPADADATWQRRFGDCKGKTALLVAILRELGIKAEAAAVNSGGGDGLNEYLPAIEVFDHVIVRAEIDGKVYWLDGTRLGDRDLDSIRPPHVRWALPLTTAGATLEAVPMLPPDKPTEDMFMRLDASAGLDVPAQARVERIIRGDEAIQFDAAYQALPTGERENALKSWWSGQYKWIEPRKVSASFDPATGEKRLTMEGPANMAWTESDDGQSWRYQTDIMSIGWSYGVGRDKGPNKSAPMIIKFPFYTRTRQEIVLPKKGKDFTIDGGAVDKTLGGAEFRRQVSLKDGVLTLESSKRALVPEIPYKDAVAAAPVLMEMWKKDVFLVAPKSYRRDRSQSAAATPSGAGSEAVVKLVAEAWEKVGQNKPDEALPLFNKALRQEPTNTGALQGRAAVFMNRGNYTAAQADLEQAFKTDPTQWTALNGIGFIQMQLQKPEEAVETFTRVLAIYPNSLSTIEARAQAYVMLKELDKARADADSMGDMGAEADTLAELRVNIAMAGHDRAAAIAVLSEALAANPNDAALRLRQARFLANCRFLDARACAASKVEAVAKFDAIIRETPTAEAHAGRAEAYPDSDRKAALEDINAAIALEPDAGWPLTTKVRLLKDAKSYDSALEAANQAVALAPKAVDERDVRADLYFAMGRPSDALADLDAIKRDNGKNAQAFNASCWGRATHNLELETALKDCNTGLGLSPRSAQILDSRAFVYLRLGRYDESIADYDAALKAVPDLPASLFGRGLARLRKGDTAGGQADIAAARKLWYEIDEEYAEYGLKP